MHIAHKKASNAEKYRRSDPIRCLPVMKEARSVFVYKEQS